MATSSDKICVIGAGSSGIATCQVLDARGIEFDCFEVGSEVGGNWRYMNDNGMSSAYRSLHINTSRRMMAYATYPMPEDYPDYPNHWQIAEYFDDYVDHFGFRDRIRFRTEVTRVEPAGGGGWRVSWRERDSGEEGSEAYARRVRRQRPPLGRALARAAVPGPGGLRGRAAARPRLQDPRRARGQAGARARDRQLGLATSRSRRRGRPSGRSWRCAAAPGCCPST